MNHKKIKIEYNINNIKWNSYSMTFGSSGLISTGFTIAFELVGVLTWEEGSEAVDFLIVSVDLNQ